MQCAHNKRYKQRAACRGSQRVMGERINTAFHSLLCLSIIGNFRGLFMWFVLCHSCYDKCKLVNKNGSPLSRSPLCNK